jgi:hypothetical protein
MSKIAVLNTEARLRQVSYGYHAPPGDNVGLHAMYFDLKPGLNVIDVEKWEQAKAQSMTQILISHGILKEGPMLADGVNPFADLSPRQAAKAILETLDPQLLERAARIEQREPIAEVLDYQRKRAEAEARGQEAPEQPDAVRQVEMLPDAAPAQAPRKKGKK